MPDPLSRSKYYRDRAAEYLALEETTTGEYFKQSCRTIADHFVTLATIEDKFVAEQAEFRRRFRIE